MAETPHTELPPRPEPARPSEGEPLDGEEHPPSRPPGRSGGGGRSSRGRRAAKWFLLMLVAPIALVILLLVGAYAGLHIGPVQRRAAAIAANQLDRIFQGTVKAESIELTGFLQVCLRGVSIDDPEYGPVITAELACADVMALALPKKHVAARGLRLVRPVVDIATVEGAGGQKTTTLSRALQARRPKQPASEPSGPMPWVIEVHDLDLSRGALRLRPKPGATPSLELDDIELKGAKARYAQDGALAKLALTAQLAIPGDVPAALELDALLNGSTKEGKLEIHKLRVGVGETGLTAWGDLDLGTRAGQLQISELRVRPRDVDALRARGGASEVAPLLSREVTGKGEVRSDGHQATVRLSLEAGGGKVELQAKSTLAAKPEWSVNLQILDVDPERVSPKAPAGKVTVKLVARGTGVPRYDERGVLGDVEGTLHVGPAHLAGMGRLAIDLDAQIAGRQGRIRSFTATAVGLKMLARGDAARDVVDLMVQIDAPDLRAVTQAISAITKKPAVAIAGQAQLHARVRGKPLAPDAEVHLRAPRFDSGESLSITDLAVDGELTGDLRKPRSLRPVGKLTLTARDVLAGAVELGAPTLRADLRWPAADLVMDAQVIGGRFDFRGHAEIDSDRDGLRLPELTVSYPGNELRLRQPVTVHFRPRDTVVEPFWLEGSHGGLGLSATLHKAPRKGEPGSIVGLLQLAKFDLSALPKFALPPDLNLHGIVSGRVAADGKLPRPTVDAHVELSGGGFKQVQGIDVKLWAHLFKNRLKAEASGSGPAGVNVSFKADAPLGNPKEVPLTAPLSGELSIRDLDVEKAAVLTGNDKLLHAGLRGVASMRAVFEGTLGAPRVTASLDLSRFNVQLRKKGDAIEADTSAAQQPQPKGLAAAASKAVGAAQASAAPPPAQGMRIREAEAHVGLWLERGLIAVDGFASMEGARPVTLLVQAPFELARALREPGYVAKAVDRPLRATVTAAQLDLKALSELGVLPEGLAGKMTGAVEMDGTFAAPMLSLTASAEGLAKGKLHGLGGTLRFDLDEQLRLQLSLTAGEDVLARLDLSLGVSGQELVQIQKLRDPKKMAERIADRPLFGELEVPGLFIGRAASLVGKERAVAEGRLVGKVHLEGTPAEPRIEGRLELQEVRTKSNNLGQAEVYVEGGPTGAVLHLGINPPNGGSLLAHATLKADLTARSILKSGLVGVMQGEVSGRLTAKKLDLAFLGGTHPYLRRAAGILDGDVEAQGLLGRPQLNGKASLRRGLFDIVGQGVFHHVSFDASFSPKEIVLDKLAGQFGSGTFTAVLVAMNRAATADQGSDRLEFTGELHLGDDESVRDRLDDNGKPLQKQPVPVRQAGEERLRVSGEVDLFGHYESGLLVATTKIPNADVHVVSLPTKKVQPLKPNKDVLLVKPGERPHPPGVDPDELDAEEKARKTANFRVQIALDLQHLYVKAEDFEFPVHSKLNFEYDARRPDRPTADGTIVVPNGSFTALGRRFQIDNAVITETGGDITNPELEIKARYEKSSTVVFITVSGSAKDPVIDLQSNPPMDQDAIAFFLATGRVQGRATQSGGSVDLQGAASSVLGGYLFGALRKELADVLPVDVLTVETGGAGISQASVGKYFGDAFFILYRQRVTPAPNENTSEGQIEYEINRSLTAQATIGDRTSDVSILWTKDF